jgi:molybdopterin-guanine dinucleotide biosynthesis protein A
LSVRQGQLGISAAILAGGLARRLGGADKASLVIGGSRIIERQLAALAAVTGGGRDVVIVANDPSRYRDLGVRIVADVIAGAGALGGLYTGLLDARHDRLLVLACDLPFVSAALLERLAVESGTGEQVDAVVPRSARGLEPLCAVYRRGIATRVKRRIDAGELRMTALLADLTVRELGHDVLAPYDDGALFENVNTPHDYARARGLGELDEKPSEDRITE